MKILYLWKLNEIQKKQAGSALVSLVVVLPFLMLITYHYTQLAVSNLQVSRKDQFHTQAQFATDASIDLAVHEINQDENWVGTGGPVELHNDGSTKSTYEVTVANDTADIKTITSTGRVYSPASSSVQQSSVTIKTTLRAINSGSYSIVTGVGGLSLSNSAKIVGGDVLVNGEINLSNSAQIGLSSNPVDVEVAHQNCPNPADSTYPRLCNSGENGQPISIQNTAHIFGNVKANNQTNGSSMTLPGLTAGSGVAAQPLPPHDRVAQKNAIVSTVTAASAGCSNGTKTWDANLKITGNVTVSGSCRITILGNVWITGTLTVRNSAQLLVADSAGSTKPNVMVDGQTTSFSNSSKLISNASETGFQIINYWSRASCSPDCSDVTGTDLYNSRNDATITLSNSAEGPETIFYSKWTRVLINNSGNIGALVGQTVELRNSSTITFGTSTSTGGEKSWIVDGYRRSF